MSDSSAKQDQQRVVLVTGAAGGLGRALVSEYIAQGWRVAAGWHREPFPETESATLRPVRLDVTNRARTETAITEIMHRWGRLDALICNAGLTADGPLALMSDEDWDRVLEVNLKGAFLCSRAALRPMIAQGDGHIVHLSSFSGRAGARGQANYSAAKAGLIGLAQSLAQEVGAHNIRVNAVLPGVLPTRMTAGLDSMTMAGFTKANALGRINTLDEVARFIAFLTSTQNISGQIFQLDSRIAPWT